MNSKVWPCQKERNTPRFHGAKNLSPGGCRASAASAASPVGRDQATTSPTLGGVVEQRQVRVRHERVQDLAVSVHAVGFDDEHTPWSARERR